MPLQTSKIIEYMDVSAHLSGVNFDVYVIYHYPGWSIISLCEELTDILENNITQNRGYLATSRGFQYSPWQSGCIRNYHIPRFMDSFGLINHTKQPTHTSNHLLDLVDIPTIIQSNSKSSKTWSFSAWSLLYSCISTCR